MKLFYFSKTTPFWFISQYRISDHWHWCSDRTPNLFIVPLFVEFIVRSYQPLCFFFSLLQYYFFSHWVIFWFNLEHMLRGWSVLSSDSNREITVICWFEGFWSWLNRNRLTYWLNLHHFFWHWWSNTRGIRSSLRTVRGVLLLILPWFNNPRILVLFLRRKALLKVGVKTYNFELMLRILILLSRNIDEFSTLVHAINFN